ncbi:hypothetical protein [uncultured Psychroserpens sp.]|uniref:hypothetical protein n=1 Tax=uncultured Psychroserpens sp. TaxID=255436 RepID=UPI0026075FB0|nr:hypothetical protein [uncultured Psychroserpens sp.]
MSTITVKNTINIKSTKENVWGFTQNFDNRKAWDESILECHVLQKKPFKLISIKTIGGIKAKLKYKICDKANKTTLKLIDVKSFIIKGGGGSWKYETENNETKWSQVNSLVFKNKFWFLILGNILRNRLEANTKKSMVIAKTMIENNNNLQQRV